MVQLIRKTIQEVNSEDYGPEMTQRYMDWVTEDRLHAEVGKKTDFLVYEEDGTILGVGGLDREKPYLRRGFVDHRHRKRGIGTKILMALEEMARERGEKKVTMHATITSVEYFERQGYVRGEREESEGFIIYPMHKSFTGDDRQPGYVRPDCTESWE